MIKTTDDAYSFNGCRVHMRAFEDPFNAEKPVYVVEVAPGDEDLLTTHRVEMAKDVADQSGRSPDQITWLEQSPDGSLKQIEFEYTHTDKFVPGANDMDLREVDRAVAAGELTADEIDRYNTHESEASLRDFQAQVGDALDPYVKRQNEEFSKMTAPAAVIDLGEMQTYPTQHEFENDPDISY